MEFKSSGCQGYRETLGKLLSSSALPSKSTKWGKRSNHTGYRRVPKIIMYCFVAITPNFDDFFLSNRNLLLHVAYEGEEFRSHLAGEF